jgi:hypothetical protein
MLSRRCNDTNTPSTNDVTSARRATKCSLSGSSVCRWIRVISRLEFLRKTFEVTRQRPVLSIVHQLTQLRLNVEKTQIVLTLNKMTDMGGSRQYPTGWLSSLSPKYASVGYDNSLAVSCLSISQSQFGEIQDSLLMTEMHQLISTSTFPRLQPEK